MRKARTLKERHPPPWIVTYADMITLMFAVFVMLYVLQDSANPDLAARKIADVFSNRFFFFDSGKSLEEQPLAIEGATIEDLPSSQNNEGLAEIKKLARGLLQETIRAQKVQVSEDERGVIISMIGNLYFSAGSAQLTYQQKDLLNKIAPFLSTIDRYIRIEGFAASDEENLLKKEQSSAQIQSTWELASQRSLAVLKYLESKNVRSQRLQTLSYGSYRSLYNIEGILPGTPEFLAKNRRVDIVILTHKATKRKPQKKNDGLPPTKIPGSEYLIPDLP